MSLGVTLSKDYKGPMEIGDYMRKVKSQYSLGKMISSYNKRYFVLDLHYKQFYYLPKKDSHYADSHQIFLGEIAKITYDHHLVLNDDQVWKYGIIIYARKKEYHLHSCSKEFIESLLFAFSHLIDTSTRTPLFNWEAYQAQIKKFETQHFSFNPQGTITLQKPIQSQPQSPEVLSSAPASVTKNPNKEESNSKKSLLEESQSPRASDKTSAPSSQTEAQDEPIEKPLEVAKDNTPPETPVETPQTLPVRENVQVVKVESTTPVIKMETNITRLRAASRNRRNNSMSVSNNFEIANFIQQSKETKNSELAGMNQVDVSQAKPQEKTNNIWGNPTHARTRNASIDARQRNKAAVHHQRAKLISFRGSGISIESPELSKQSNTADRQDSTTPETNNSSPPKSSCDEDNQTPLNNEDWDKELFGGDDDKKQVNIRMKKSSRNPENYNFRPAVPVHNDWDDELDL